VVEAFEPLGPAYEVVGEDRARVGEREVVRNGGGPEQDDADCQRCDDENANGALQSASPEAGSAGASSSASTSRRPSSTGAA
jgi:hypothetical protein